MNTEASAPSRTTLTLVAFGLGVFGLISLLHGTGVFSANWLNPNPDVPPWIFSAVGVFMLAAAFLVFAQVQKNFSAFVNPVGWLTLALSWVLAHWLLLFANNATCFVGFVSYWISFDKICHYLGALLLAPVDLIILAVLIQSLRRKIK